MASAAIEQFLAGKGVLRAGWTALWVLALGGGLVVACTFDLEDPLDRPNGAGATSGGASGGGGAPMESGGQSQSQSKPAPAETAPMDDGFDDIPF